MLKGMRKYVFGAAAATALFVIPISAFSQSIEVGPGGVRVYDGRGGGQCEQLRRACENKDALGERGEGNCRRYRETCQRPVRRDECGELRQACLLRVNHQCGLSFRVGAVSLRHWSTRPIKRDGPVGAAILPDPADCAKRPDLSYPPTRPSAI